MVTTTPRQALKSVFARLANVPLNCVVWRGENELNGKPPTSLLVTGATNASPIVLTVPQGVCVADGSPLTVAGVAGNTAANAAWDSITVVDSTHVSLDGSVGNGDYVSGGTASPPSPFRWGLMRIAASSREGEGWDDNRRTDNGDGTFSMKTVGGRRITLSCDYFSFDPSLEVMADDVLEEVRTRLWDGDILNAFNTVGCTPVTYGNVVPLPLGVNGTERSGAHLDIVIRMAVWNTLVNERGSKGGVNDYINEVKGTGTITEVDGTETTETIDVTAT